MAEKRIIRKNLWQQLGNIKRRESWINAAECLGLLVTQPPGGSSHYAIRRPNIPRENIKGHIVNVYEPLRKDVNEKIFKALLSAGLKEEDIWKCLRMLELE